MSLRDLIRKWLGIKQINKKLENIDERLTRVEKDRVRRQDLTRNRRVTEKEKEILGVIEGQEFLSIKEIANVLGKKSGTVRSHINNIKKKLELEVTKEGKAKLYRVKSDKKEQLLRN